MVCASIERLSLLPLSAGAAATLIGRNLALSITPAAIAAAALPSAARTAVAASCDDPANWSADIRIGATKPITGCATAPKEADNTNIPGVNDNPARAPAQNVPVTDLPPRRTRIRRLPGLGGSVCQPSNLHTAYPRGHRGVRPLRSDAGTPAPAANFNL